jgi:hypothetical protein
MVQSHKKEKTDEERKNGKNIQQLDNLGKPKPAEGIYGRDSTAGRTRYCSCGRLGTAECIPI